VGDSGDSVAPGDRESSGVTGRLGVSAPFGLDGLFSDNSDIAVAQRAGN
jgi:hypothetical protein